MGFFRTAGVYHSVDMGMIQPRDWKLLILLGAGL